jgi:hypothetical protein
MVIFDLSRRSWKNEYQGKYPSNNMAPNGYPADHLAYVSGACV